MHTTPNIGDRVAVIGGGPSGIIVAKELLEAGLEPVVLEQSEGLGGQWRAGACHSGVWPGMRANTSGAMTRFSQRPTPADWPLFPRAEQVGAELTAYADATGVSARTRFGARVTAVTPADDGYLVRYEQGADGTQATEHVAGVVACSGRFATPARPEALVAPLDGRVTVLHAGAYRGRDALRGRRVLVVGNSISGLEIAADLAMDPSITVISSARRARWIIPKLAAGVPADQHWFTSFAALLGQTLPPAELAAGLREALLQAAGDPAAVGGLTPDDDLLAAGLSQCQHYLPLVAEGRIDVRPGIATIAGDAATFTDGTSCAIDAVVLATGYERHLPYLADSERGLVLETFDPARPGLAFMGQFVLHGPYLPVLELQARWIAAVWSGRRSVGDAPPVPGLPHYPHHLLAEAFAAAAGATPDADAHPELADALHFGPMLPERYRLDDPEAVARFASATAGFVVPPGQAEARAMLTAQAAPVPA
jgi:cation diffusion facilitator CzcD-associated flavoprotein CzcO